MTRPRIGVSACFFHADPKRNLFKGKTLLYAEESMLRFLMEHGALPVLLPRAYGRLEVADLVSEIDGLLLQGGADMAPESYGETPLRPEWSGDRLRDVYEMELVEACLAADRPILGVCRGHQVLNVALGGSLYQDVELMHPEKRTHRNWDLYDAHGHEIAVAPDSALARWYGLTAAAPCGKVNSVHHQAVHRLGHDLVVEAHSVPDGVIEAIRYVGRNADGHTPFAYGVQWHPEFMADADDDGLLDPDVLAGAFLEEVNRRKTERRTP